MPPTIPFVVCIDVGSPKNIGWADSEGKEGDANSLATCMRTIADHLKVKKQVALGFEAPIWTPRRSDLMQITSTRLGIEQKSNRAWSASAGSTVLATALALMPWCLSHIEKNAPKSSATTDATKFKEGGAKLLVWEAFVSGDAKGTDHIQDAKAAVYSFINRYSELISDIQSEDAVNHAAFAIYLAGLSIDCNEFDKATLVISASNKLK